MTDNIVNLNEKAGVKRIPGNGIWESYSVRDGIPDMKVESIAQDGHGAIWVGTHDCGVARVDGGEFKCFDREDGLAGNGVYSITEDNDGNLWFGTNRGLTVFDGMKFDSSISIESDGLLWGSCRDQRGDLWFGLGRRPGKPPAVCRWNGSRTEVISVGDGVSEFGESIHAIHEDQNGILWLGGDSLYCCEVSRRGLSRCNQDILDMSRVWDIQADGKAIVLATESGVWRIVDGEATQSSMMPAPGARALTIDPVSRCWIACAKGQLILLQGTHQQTIRDFRRPIQCAHVDWEGRLWVGTYGHGLYRWDPNVWRVYDGQGQVKVDPNCLASIADGGIVVGSTDGLWRSSDGETLEKIELELRYKSRDITAICVSGKRTWIGGRSGWVAHVNGERYTDVPMPKEAGAFHVSSLCYDVWNDRIWYAASPGRGIGMIGPNGRVTHFGPRNKKGVPLWVCALVFSESQRRIRGGTQAGNGSDSVFEIDDGFFQFLGAPFDLTVSAISEYRGEVFLGTSGGVFRLNSDGLCPLSADKAAPCGVVTCLHFDRNGTLWIGTEGGGIGRYDGNLLLVMEVPGGPAFNNVRDITTDSNGCAWIATEGGLLRYEPTLADLAPILRVVAVGEQILGDRSGSVQRSVPIELEFTDANRTNSSRSLFFQYRVLELGDTWLTTERHSVRLGALDAGCYNIECRVVDIDFNYSSIISYNLLVEEDDCEMIIREAFATNSSEVDLLGDSPQISHVRSALRQVAESDMTVLILGETGTGKSVAAKLLHEISARNAGPFVQINCGAIVESLAEAELFGHEKGAFTGAISRRVGKFQIAQGGTIFLDEIGDLPTAIQAKLLHVLQDRQVEPVGASMPHPIDVRVVAATNRNLADAVREGRFREDLLYRLNVFTINLPSLRSRPSDLPTLAKHFAVTFAKHLRRSCPEITTEAMVALKAYHWPGNVRELEHMIQRAVILSADAGEIGVSELSVSHINPSSQSVQMDSPFNTLEDTERTYIRRVLDHTGWVVQGGHGAARLLGLNPSTLRSRMKKLGIKK